MFKKLASALLCIALLASSFAGCSGGGESSASGESSTTGSSTSSEAEASSTGTEENTSPYEEFITVDVFDGQANYQGIHGGWFGEIVKEKFNM